MFISPSERVTCVPCWAPPGGLLRVSRLATHLRAAGEADGIPATLEVSGSHDGFFQPVDYPEGSKRTEKSQKAQKSSMWNHPKACLRSHFGTLTSDPSFGHFSWGKPRLEHPPGEVWRAGRAGHHNDDHHHHHHVNTGWNWWLWEAPNIGYHEDMMGYSGEIMFDVLTNWDTLDYGRSYAFPKKIDMGDLHKQQTGRIYIKHV